MKQLGQFLKTQRETKKLSISEVAMATKINSRVLIAIEDGNKSALPSRTYVRGFVVTYADFLKLNKEEVVSMFNEENKVAVAQSMDNMNTAITPKNTTPFLKQSSMESKIVIVIVIIILIGLIIGIKNIISKYENEANNVEPATEVQSLKIEEKPMLVDSKKESAPTPTNVDKNNTSNTVKTVTTMKPVAPKKVIAEKPLAVKTTTPTAEAAKIIAKPKPVVPTPPKPAPPKPTPIKELPAKIVKEKKVVTAKLVSQEIIIEALDKVDLNYKTQSGQVKSFTLEPDQVYTIKVKGKVFLNFSDGGAVNLIRNGKDLGVPGELGQSLELTLPKK
ncbi:MAG: helix-turn-helix domain-containing protein [Bdellovibrionaceae bacterium]|jgi:cytoskeleton protein RodZ|nr:helix-turn-helix domain-containing protein [Pseudobdellovibrionaceae bacterium]